MRLTDQVHLALKNLVRSGDTTIDATTGNGHDCLAMAELVGPNGRVYAIDIQRTAIESTRTRLLEAGLAERCTLLQGDHAEVLISLNNENVRAVAITFNLGYLPGSDKVLTTTPAATLRALKSASHLLKPNGILLVTAYRGHPGGKEEANQVEKWMQALPENVWSVEVREPTINDAGRLPPILWIASRRKDTHEKGM